MRRLVAVFVGTNREFRQYLQESIKFLATTLLTKGGTMQWR